jgi:glycosyltransferase involved in cell wall biosynthesis
MDRSLTILHLISLMGMGGRCATALRQVRLLSARGHRVLVGCIRGSAAASRAREMGAIVCDDFRFRRGFRPLDFLHDCRLLKSLCREHGVSVVHAHVSQESWVACLGARLCRPRPVVIRSRGVVVPVAPHLFNRWMHNSLTGRLIVPSRVIYDRMSNLPGFSPGKIVLLPDGVDIERFSPAVDGSTIRAEFNIPFDAPLVAMVARLERVKGHEVFFQALVTLRKAVPNVRGLCACDERTPGEYDKAVRRARELGLGEELLSFTGMRNDVEKIVAAANVIALPSLGSEGSSRVALEAAASARPIVASSVGCLPEVVVDGKTGLIVPPGDAPALAAGLAGILQAPTLAREMGCAARARAEELYDERKMAEKLEQVYRGQTERGS